MFINLILFVNLTLKTYNIYNSAHLTGKVITANVQSVISNLTNRAYQVTA